MAELYPMGLQRIFYKASRNGNFNVEASVRSPDLSSATQYSFSKLEGTERIYFSDVDFFTEGIWIAIFYENGEEKQVQAYNTKKLPSEVEVTFRGGSKGPSVIN